MKNTLNKVLIFTAGATIGSVVTWKLIEAKYKQIAQEEIDSVKEAFSRLNDSESTNDSDMTEEDLERLEYTAQAERYISPDTAESMQTYFENRREEADDISKPYVIKPDEFDEMAYENDEGETIEYDTISLKYYADGVLTDENNVPVDDIENTVGLDSLNRFGEYEEDSVFVRNDELKCDYEILLMDENYFDIIRKRPDNNE